MSLSASQIASVSAVLKAVSRVEVNDGSAGLLPSACYTDPDFFQFERDVVFAKAWICLGHEQQIPQPGDFLTGTMGREAVIVVRGDDGVIRAMSAVCQHRGEVLVTEGGHVERLFRCPLHAWTYDLQGRLVGAPRMGEGALKTLRDCVSLPQIRLEIWHGFLFATLDDDALPVAQTLAKLEPVWAGYETSDLIAVPPVLSDTPLPWNWKVHVENFTDAYHPEYVHRGTHDFAPSVLDNDGVAFTEMGPQDDAIVRSVPMRQPDGGMTSTGWGTPPEFPPIETLSTTQRSRITFALIPPSMTLIFAPTHIGYALLRPVGAEATLAASDRVTGGGWLLPRSTVNLPDFDARSSRVREGGGKIWAQDVPVNFGMQIGKRSRFCPPDRYGPLEKTLVQFNAWLVRKYLGAARNADYRPT